MFVRMNGWRRFERGSRDGSNDRFWAIRVIGRDCKIQFGPIGGAEVTEERLEHASEAEAARVAKQKIRTKQRAGWIEVEQLDDARVLALAQGEVLEQAIAAELSNLDNWAVYADWLQAIEPLLGERVALGLALARVGPKPGRTQLEARIEELERSHARELFGVSLAGVLNAAKFEGVVELERQLGMIVGARLREPDEEIVKFDALVAALLDLPLARVLVDLRIQTGIRARSLAQVIELFAARRHPQLRRLALGVERRYEQPVGVTLPGIQAVLGCTPRLEQLELYGAFDGEATHERLRELKVHRPRGALSLTLARWHLPALQTLHVIEPGAVDWLHARGNRPYSACGLRAGSLRVPRADWHVVELPQLKRLVIEWWGCGDRLVVRLARAPLLDQLDSLVLVYTRLTVHGVRTILDNAERFAKIRQLVLLDVASDASDVEPLYATFPGIVVHINH
jgi:predicted DNA-binding WGR domain protein